MSKNEKWKCRVIMQNKLDGLPEFGNIIYETKPERESFGGILEEVTRSKMRCFAADDAFVLLDNDKYQHVYIIEWQYFDKKNETDNEFLICPKTIWKDNEWL